MKRTGLKISVTLVVIVILGVSIIRYVNISSDLKNTIKSEEIISDKENNNVEENTAEDSSEGKVSYEGITERDDESKGEDLLEESKIDERNDLYNRLTRNDSQGLVSINSTLMNPIEENDEYIVFEMYFNTHSVNLDQYDLGKVVEFRTSEGLEIKDKIIWEKGEGSGGHHYYGYYKISKNIDGKAVITEKTSEIKLHIKGIDNIEDRELQWDKESIDLYRSNG